VRSGGSNAEVQKTAKDYPTAGQHAASEQVTLLVDCAEICQTSANFMLRKSKLHTRTCDVCAEVCERCTGSCDSIGDDPRMRACAEECRRCASPCREMAGVAA
jgi:hypothetical protein